MIETSSGQEAPALKAMEDATTYLRNQREYQVRVYARSFITQLNPNLVAFGNPGAPEALQPAS